MNTPSSSSIGVRVNFLPDGSYWPCAQGVQVQRINMLTNQVGSHILPCSLEQFEQGRSSARQGELVQGAFAFLSPPDREFLISGIPPQQWAELFPPPLVFSQVAVEQLLVELTPVIGELFGGTAARPLDLEALVAEVLRDFDPLPNQTELLRLQQWARDWSLQQGLLLTP